LDVQLTRGKGPVMKVKASGGVDGQLAVEAERLCTPAVLARAVV
jgi:hypothetical protein